MEQIVIKFKCPHCQQLLAFRKPASAVGVTITCPRCHVPVKVRLQGSMSGQSTRPAAEQLRMAMLVLTEGPQALSSSFRLRMGSNVIGRQDDGTVQDISLNGDPTVSRRSVDLRVEAGMNGGYTYRLTVLNAKNPVYVNKTPLCIGSSISMRVGDIITLGRTKLMLNV